MRYGKLVAVATSHVCDSLWQFVSYLYKDALPEGFPCYPRKKLPHLLYNTQHCAVDLFESMTASTFTTCICCLHAAATLVIDLLCKKRPQIFLLSFTISKAKKSDYDDEEASVLVCLFLSSSLKVEFFGQVFRLSHKKVKILTVQKQNLISMNLNLDQIFARKHPRFVILLGVSNHCDKCDFHWSTTKKINPWSIIIHDRLPAWCSSSSTVPFPSKAA